MTKGHAQIPNSRSTIDLGRCMVHPEYRGYNLMRIICIAALLVAKRKGYRYANGASRPGRGLIRMLEEIGYETSGRVVHSYEPNGNIVEIQLFTCEFAKLEIELKQLLNDAQYDLLLKGISLHINI